MRYGLPLLFAFLILPAVAHAEVMINEIAWMGTDEGGANCEWIELRNAADEVIDLSTWTLTIENSGAATPKVLNLGEAASVKYSGIAENGYYLIARDSGSCKNLSPSDSADWLGSFGNGISNSGAKLTLKNGADEEDAVDSKNGWGASDGGIGGSNSAPKKTPQWTGAEWIADTPTPRGPNHTAPLDEIPDPIDATTSPTVTIGGTAPLVPVANPVPTLYVDGGPARIVVAGAATAFSAVAYDSLGTVFRGAKITWSFGDGGYERGREAEYAYEKPGSYTATVRARVKGGTAVSLIPVDVVAADVAITDASDDGVRIANRSGRLLDLSGWRIDTGRRPVKLPPDTVLAAGASAFFSYEALNTSADEAPSLLYPGGKLAYAYAQPSAGDGGLSGVQAVEPARNLANTDIGAYGNGITAPAAQATLAAAGAAVSSETPTVILKDERPSGVSKIFHYLLASVTALVGH